MVADIFAKSESSNAEIKLSLDDKGVEITHDLILSVLGNPDTDPNVAKRVIDWVLENESENLSSESFNLMLRVLGGNGFVKETWDILEIMKEKAYVVSSDAFSRISERFQKDGLNDDVEKLKEFCGLCSSEENAVVDDYCRVSEVIMREVWGDDLEKQLRELDVEFSSDLVARVLGNLEMDPNKALIFFRWVQESGMFKHDQRSFNAMARVLGGEDQSEKFWRFANEMKSEGHEMERETYIHILGQFVKKGMMKDAVDLYEFTMNGEMKSLEEDCVFLLNEIVVSEELDMDLFRSVLGFFKENGNATTDAILDTIVKSLVSVGRVNNEGNQILVAMKEAGCVPSGPLRCKIALELSSGGNTELALGFMDTMVPSTDYLAWESLVLGFCKYGNLDEASNSLRKMVENGGASCAKHSLEALVTTYYEKNEPLDAYKVVLGMVNDKGIIPRYTTYKRLTKGLLALNYFKEALDVMSMIKKQGDCPYFDPFVEYLPRAGSVKDAIEFTRAMTTKRYPAISVFIRLFEGYFTAGRLSEAQDFLSKCPGSIKNHADVLNLFASRMSGETSVEGVAV